MLFLLWLCLFILYGVISPLTSSHISGTYWPGEFISQCPILLPFPTVHGILQARIPKWFAIPFSSGTRFCQNSPQWLVCLGWSYMTWLTVSLIQTSLCSMWSDGLVFCDCGFQSVCPLMEKDKKLWKLPDGRNWLRGKPNLILVGRDMLSNAPLFPYSQL